MANNVTVQQNNEHVSRAFMWFHATSVNGGAMMISAAVASYFAVFMTDTMLLPAAAASIIMLVSSLWDAINDPIMGVIADRTNTRFGRYRPYFLFAPILVMIFGTLIWVNPDFSTTGKIIYTLICYIGFGMTVTMYTMPQMAVLPACVKDNQKRNTIIAMGAGVTAVAFTISSTFTTNITAFFQSMGFSNGYIPYMLICGVLACISFWGLFATSEEKYLSKIQDRPVRQDLMKVLKHKELAPFIIVWIMGSMGYGLMFASSVFYVMYYLARPDLITLYMGIVAIGALVSMVVLLPLFLKIFKTGQKALTACQIGAILCYIVLFLFGRYNLTFLYVMTFIATSIASMQNALVNVLVNDAIDYIQLKEGFSANGIIASIKGFAQKCGSTVTNSGILAVLAASGYIANAIGGQPDSTMFALNFLRFGAPALTGVIMLFCLRFNPIEKHYDEIEEMKLHMHETVDQNEE
ncbi:MAG: MFS transporter [Lachnospiraceae bacterium]